MNRVEKRKLAKLSKKKNSELQLSQQDLAKLASNMILNEEFREAERIYNKLMALDDTNTSVLHFAGITKYKLGEYDDALNLLNKSITISPDYAEAHNSKGIILFQQRKYDESLKCFNEAVLLKPNYANAYLNLGNAYYELKDLDQAIKSYETSFTLNNNIEAAYKLAGIHLTIDDASSALEYANYTLQINPHCQHALAYKAIANWGLGNSSGWKDLYNYEEMIYQLDITTPHGYSSLKEFNNSLANDIFNHKSLVWEPLERVTNGGAVTSDLLLKPTRSIKSLKNSISKAVDELKKSLIKDKENPLCRIIPDNYKMTLVGSILKEHGVHPPHIHENSRLSGVYYVHIPDFISRDDSSHYVWLEFGRPNLKINSDVGLEITTRYPEEGTLLIFPSYFFHGTIPFESRGDRIGIAFDLYPIC